MATKFIETDINTNLANLRAKLASKLTWIDIYESSTGTVLEEIPINAAEQLLYYIQRRCEEVYINKLKNKSSAVNLTRLLNYDVSRVVSSTGTVRFTIATALPTTVLIPKYTKLATSDGTKYVTKSESAINPGNLFVDVAVMQGERATTSIISDGGENQIVSITDTDVENTSIVVTVDGIQWTEFDAFLTMEGDTLGYVERNNNDDTVDVQFGDNINGFIPASGSVISVVYVKSIGADGNASAGAITTCSDTLYDNAGNAATVTVSNTTKMLGGQDAESLSEIRYNAPRVFKTGDRCCNKQDYISFLKKYSGIVSANAWGEFEEGAPVIANFNKAFISIILEDWAIADTAFKNQITSDLFDSKGMMTVFYEFVDPTIVEIAVDDYAIIETAASLATMQASIETTLDSLFQLGLSTQTINGLEQTIGVDIGSSIYYSNVVKTIDSIASIKYHSLTMNGWQTVGTGDGSTVSFTDDLHLLNVTTKTVFIYVNDVLVGHDDGSGVIVPDSAVLSTGSVNYTSGHVTLSFATAPAASADIRCKYKPMHSTSAPNDLVPSRSQILKLVKKNVTTAYA